MISRERAVTVRGRTLRIPEPSPPAPDLSRLPPTARPTPEADGFPAITLLPPPMPHFPDLPPDRPVYSYDFDGVLHLDMEPDPDAPGFYRNRDFHNPTRWPPFERLHRQLREQAAYATIVVVTARDEWNLPEIRAFLCRHRLPVHSVHCTNDGPKRAALLALGAARHYDDRDYGPELAGTGVEFILVDPGPFL
jgi:hypothetical protein